MVGKIHLNGKMQGFDYWEVLPGQGKYYSPDFITADGRKVPPVLIPLAVHCIRRSMVDPVGWQFKRMTG
jgi:hypothetical protein